MGKKLQLLHPLSGTIIHCSLGRGSLVRSAVSLLVSVLVITCMDFAHANLKDKDNRLQARPGYSNGTMILAPVD